MISLLSSNSEDFDTQLSSLIAWEANSDEEINNTVRKIIKEVKDKGDSSVLKLLQSLIHLTQNQSQN